MTMNPSFAPRPPNTIPLLSHNHTSTKPVRVMPILKQMSIIHTPHNFLFTEFFPSEFYSHLGGFLCIVSGRSQTSEVLYPNRKMLPPLHICQCCSHRQQLTHAGNKLHLHPVSFPYFACDIIYTVLLWKLTTTCPLTIYKHFFFYIQELFPVRRTLEDSLLCFPNPKKNPVNKLRSHNYP